MVSFSAFRAAVLAVPAALMLALPAQADKLPLSQISSYLNAMKTAQGDFTQINDDGTISTGKIYIKRPGRIRFEYAPPQALLVLASGGAVAVHDPKGSTETYPLNKTPLSLILAQNVDLGRAKMVVGHTSDGKTTTVRAQDPEHPEYGSIDLVFTDNPVQLRQWVIHDEGGSATTVVLGELKSGGALGNGIFNIELQTRRASDR
ncbi:outer membrane lipoprotein carrier protein LolA [Litorivita sp. NS0012-18]|uniref:LolA family protein n=1 Tax=Litorivita sp. NS0012-18 TaxID=3127655 RepID=UPI00310732EE